MSSNTSSGSNTSSMAVPEAKEAMKRFKEEVASEIGVPLKEGYNGDLTSRQAGSIYNSCILFVNNFFVISLNNKSKEKTLNTE